MSEIDTFDELDLTPEETSTLPTDLCTAQLREQQKADIRGMRSALLACNRKSPLSVKNAINNIVVMRVYHQLARIIKFTEIMDELEEKMYETIHNTIQSSSSYETSTMLLLLKTQSQLLENMAASEKLIQPYLNLDLNQYVTVEDETEDSSKILLDAQQREHLRTNAQMAISALTQQGGAEK